MRIDRRFVRCVQAAIVVAFVLGGAMPVSAIIKVDVPVSRVYKEASIVAVGEVTRISADDGVECTVREVLKGRLPDSKLAIHGPADLVREVKAGRALVAFIKGRQKGFQPVRGG